MKFQANTKFPDGIFVIYQSEHHHMVVTNLSLTSDGGDENSTTYQLRAVSMKIDHIDDGNHVVLFDPDDIRRIEQISQSRYEHILELTKRQEQSKDIQSAMQLAQLIEQGKQVGIIRKTDQVAIGNSAEVGVSQPQISNTRVDNSNGNIAVGGPFQPESVPLNPVESAQANIPSNRDEEVAEHQNTLIDVPPPGS